MSQIAFFHLGLNCKDPLITERFYTRHFGFKRARVVPLGGEQIVFLKSGSLYLEVFQAKGSSPEPPYQNDGPTHAGVRHLAFQVDDVEAKLREMGNEAEITLGPLAFDDFIQGWKAVWIRDPDGRIIEICQGYRDQENPPPLAD